VSAKVKHHSEGNPWWLTTVYGPQEEQEKIIFLDELRQLRLGRVGPWILCGDFNLICMATDKNNGRLNQRLMGKMRRFL
jgi:exonuclease III